MPVDGKLPIELEMIDPVCRFDQGRAATGERVGQPDTISGSAISDLLLKLRRRKVGGRRQTIFLVEFDSVGLDRPGYIFQGLRSERSE